MMATLNQKVTIEDAWAVPSDFDEMERLHGSLAPIITAYKILNQSGIDVNLADIEDAGIEGGDLVVKYRLPLKQYISDLIQTGADYSIIEQMLDELKLPTDLRNRAQEFMKHKYAVETLPKTLMIERGSKTVLTADNRPILKLSTAFVDRTSLNKILDEINVKLGARFMLADVEGDVVTLMRIDDV